MQFRDTHGLSGSPDSCSDFVAHTLGGPSKATSRRRRIPAVNSPLRFDKEIAQRPKPSPSLLCYNQRKGVNLNLNMAIWRMWQKMALHFIHDRTSSHWIRIVRQLLQLHFKDVCLEQVIFRVDNSKDEDWLRFARQLLQLHFKDVCLEHVCLRGDSFEDEECDDSFSDDSSVSMFGKSLVRLSERMRRKKKGQTLEIVTISALCASQ